MTVDMPPLDLVLDGECVQSGDPDYDTLRMGFNLAIDRRPAVIARCATTDDVAKAIKFARANDLPLAVRGGGNHVAGFATVDDGVIIELGKMKQVEVDPVAKTARVGGGVLMADIHAAASPHGLAAVSGAFSWIGLGLVLAGGIGFMSARAGFASDNILSAQLVTAEGEVITCSPTENTDLYWAVRGAGANFGVVTSLELQLHDVHPEMTSGMYLYDARDPEKTRELLRAILDHDEQMSENMSLYPEFAVGDAAYGIPEELDGQPVFQIGVAHLGSPEQAAEEVARFEAIRKPDWQMVFRGPHAETLYANDDFALPARTYSEEVAVSEMTDEVIQFIVDQVQTLQAGDSFLITSLRGAMGRPPERPSAQPRGWAYSLGLMPLWTEASDDARQIERIEGRMKALREAGVGRPRGYTNMMSRSDQARLREVYGEENYDRLAKLKGVWDPENVFCSNHNISPEA